MIFTILSKYLSIAAQVLIIVITFKVYGNQSRGMIAALTAISGVFGAVFSCTIGRSLYQILTKNSFENTIRYYYFKVILYLVFLLSCLSIFVQFILFSIHPKFYGNVDPHLVNVFIFTAFYYVWVQVGPYIYSVEGKINIYNNISLLSSFLLFLVSIYVMLTESLNFYFFIYVIVTVYAIEFVAGYSYLFWKSRIFSFDYSKAIIVLKEGLSIHIDTIGGLLFSSVLIIILNYKMNLEDVAIYDVGLKFFTIICVIPQMLQLFYAKNVIEDNSSELLNNQLKYFKFIIKLFPVLFSLYLLIIYVFILLFDLDQRILIVSAILCLSLPAYVYCSIISPYWLKFGYSLGLSIVTLSIGILGLLLSVLTINAFENLYLVVLVVMLNYYIAMYANTIFYKKIVLNGYVN